MTRYSVKKTGHQVLGLHSGGMRRPGTGGNKGAGSPSTPRPNGMISLSDPLTKMRSRRRAE